MNPYEEKQEARRRRYEQKAQEQQKEAERKFNGPNGRILVSMQGEPVKIGHHSERRHRRLIEKAHNEMRQGSEALAKSKHYARKAAAVGTGGISSDDPEAIDKLREKLATLQAKQDEMKKVNRLIRKHAKAGPEAQISALVAAGYGEAGARAAVVPAQSWMGQGFPAYELQNNNANIRRVLQRIADLEAAADAEEVEEEGDGYTYREDPDMNRVQFFFDGKPSAEVRTILKGHGFKWARSLGAWQRQMTNAGRYAAQQVRQKLDQLGD